MNKGDKYIIEIAEVQKYHTDNGDEFELGRVKGFKALTLDESALKKLKPLQFANIIDIFDDATICGYEPRQLMAFADACHRAGIKESDLHEFVGNVEFANNYLVSKVKENFLNMAEWSEVMGHVNTVVAPGKFEGDPDGGEE